MNTKSGFLKIKPQGAPDCEGRKRPEPNEDLGIDLIQARSNENEKIKTWRFLPGKAA
jgi:hypothetical protein